MKQRELTDKQRRLIEMDMEGATDAAIAAELGIHFSTVAKKRADLRRGLSKGAYCNIPAMPTTEDLFS